MHTIDFHAFGPKAGRLREWLAANTIVPGWLDGYPLGRAYIDTRVRGGKTYRARRAYLAIDQRTAREVPECAGMTSGQVRALLARLEV